MGTEELVPYVYLVECNDGSLYTGWAMNVERRVKAHNSGRGAKYTKLHRPVKLVYFEEWPTRSEAMKREAAIKRWPRVKKLKLIGIRDQAKIT